MLCCSRLRFYSADTLLQPLAIHKVWLRVCAASRRKITRRGCGSIPPILCCSRLRLCCFTVGRGPRAPPLNVRQAAGHMGPALQDYLQGDRASRLPLHLLRHAQLGAAGAGVVRQLLLAGAAECTSGGGTHGSRPTGLFAGGYGVLRALIPSLPRAAWRCGRGDCAPAPPRRRRWACGSPAAAWASCRTRTPGIPAGRCSRWPAPAWFS